MKKNITQQILDKAIELIVMKDKDKMIYGESFVEFGERSIKILDPSTIILNRKVNKKGKPYGIGILERYYKLMPWKKGEFKKWRKSKNE